MLNRLKALVENEDNIEQMGNVCREMETERIQRKF